MTKFTIESKQLTETKNEIQNAMQKIGEHFGYEYDVIEKTINDMSIIDNLYFCYNVNEHNIHAKNMFNYFMQLNDYEQNGVVENFEHYNN